MKRLVLDASVTMAWCFEDECDEYADAVLGALEQGEAFVPCVWPLEVANVLLVAERRERLSAAAAAQFLTLVSGLGVEVVHDSPARNWSATRDLARRVGLSAYDASYLDLAMRVGLPLATRDDRVRAACTTVGLPVFGLTD